MQRILFRSPLTIGRYISVAQPALRFRNTSDARFVEQSPTSMSVLNVSQGVFPHGIDVLGKIDFFAVGVRRNAFLVAAPQVAEYVVI